MKKVVYNKCGNADVLQVEEVRMPLPRGKNEVLVKVLFSSLNAVDWKYRSGHFRIFTAIFKTNLGYDIVGEVIKVSNNISDYKKGDIVLGLLPTLSGGAHSEYVVLNTNQFIGISPEENLIEMAGLPMAGVTAWISLVEKAKLKMGQKVLINGGSSGVGHLAIQIAKAHDAEVTSISSKKNVKFCRSIGADHTIDYQSQDFRVLGDKYDIIFDVVSNTSISQIRSILKPGGCYVDTNISLRLICDMILHPKQVQFVYVYPYVKALTEIYNLVKQQKVKVHVDKIYQFDCIIDAHRYVEKSRTTGKVIIKMT